MENNLEKQYSPNTRVPNFLCRHYIDLCFGTDNEKKTHTQITATAIKLRTDVKIHIVVKLRHK